jgi:hypothetical protein
MKARMKTMKLGIAIAIACLAVAIAAAQDTKTRVIVEDGKEMTVTGCVQRNSDGSLTLRHAAGKDGTVGSYILALLDDDEDDELDALKDHVGHRVEIRGKAADRGQGRLRVKTESEVRKADGEKGKTETRAELKGDLNGLPFLGVKSSRMIASVCP